MSLDSKYNIIKMNYDHLPGLMRLKELAHWNQTEDDWRIFIDNYAAHAFVVMNESMVVGSATAVNYQNQAAWIGMVLVHPEHRKRGIASELMRQVIASLQGCRSIKLDATPVGREVYLRLGFKDEEEVIRFTTQEALPVNLHAMEVVSVIPAKNCGVISDFDRKVFGCDRSVLLEGLYHNQPELSFLICDAEDVKGFCLGRQGSEYYQIGPVSATSAEDAGHLIGKVLLQLRGKRVMVDLPSRHLPELGDDLAAAGFVKQRSFIRMYLNINHPTDWDKYFACAGPEFG
jgi:GNAT superfamily N-acetyltransferase